MTLVRAFFALSFLAMFAAKLATATDLYDNMPAPNALGFRNPAGVAVDTSNATKFVHRSLGIRVSF